MLVYKYNATTSEFMGSEQADESPLEPGKYLVPAHSTDIAPPTTAANEVAVFENGGWVVKPDFRGVSYWLSYDESKTITAIGDTIPSSAMTSKPDPSLSTVQTNKIIDLTKSCGDSIVAGYLSSALGSEHTYPSKVTDQQNMAASVIDSLVVKQNSVDWSSGNSVNKGDIITLNGEYVVATKAGTTGTSEPATPSYGSNSTDGTTELQLWTTAFWCADSNDNWSFIPHTVSQIQKAGADGKSFIQSQQAKLESLKSGVLKSTTVAEVQAIIWS